MAVEFIPDYTKLPGDIILQQINHDNDSTLSLEQVTFGSPVATFDEAANTALDVIPKPLSNLKDKVTIIYNRVNLTQISEWLSTDFDKGDAIKISDLMGDINSRYGINMQPEDYVDAFLPRLSSVDTRESFVLKAKPGSLVWVGEVTLHVVGVDTPTEGLDPTGLPSEFPVMIA